MNNIAFEHNMNIVTDQATDTTEQYNTYYNGNKKSLYNKRFGKNRIIPREASIINKTFKQVIVKLKSEINSSSQANKFVFRMLDYGCGDGRLFDQLEKNILACKHLDIIFEINAYDISEIALLCFEENLQNKSYKINDTANYLLQQQADYNNTIYKSFSYKNIIVNLIQGKVDYHVDYIKKIIGSNIHLNLCMFSTLSHIKGKLARQEILGMFKDQSHVEGKIIITVPAYKMLFNEIKTFNLLRKHYDIAKNNQFACIYSELLKPIVDMAPEEGDVYYSRCNKQKSIVNYCNVSTYEKFRKELINSGFVNPQIEILCITHLPDLTKKHKFIKILDQALCSILSYRLVYKPIVNAVANEYICII